jgi:acyl carrier protein
MDDISKTSPEGSQAIEPGSIAAQIVEVTTEIIGADVAEFLVFTKQSSFIKDMEMDSLQIIHLATRVNETYGEKADFIGWLSAQPINELLDLTIGDVAAFLEENT